MSYMILVFFLLHLKLAQSSTTASDDFIFYGYSNKSLELHGDARARAEGFIKLTDDGLNQEGYLFYSQPLRFKNSNNSAFSFSTSFLFTIISHDQSLSGHGIAFVISPSKSFPGALPNHYLGLFNDTNNGNQFNHIVAVELDTIRSPQFMDINNNHVGIDINGLESINSSRAGYYTDGVAVADGFRDLRLVSGDPMQVWVEYDGVAKQLNVTVAPFNMTKPHFPLLSLALDLSPYILENMYVGFSSSTGSVPATHYLLGWSFKMNGQAQSFNLSLLPDDLPRNDKIPTSVQAEEKHKKKPKVLAWLLPLTAVLFLLAAMASGLLTYRRKIKFSEVLEDWEVQYGPHRFRYKDLFVATKGFKEKELLGRGGFGEVYRGVLPSSRVQVAVKKVAHDSAQGMKEFIAEIATIGRLRHPNLVLLLGYCRRKRELLLVYDFMPNGSLNKFIFDQPKMILSWEQRFKIIRDVASGLLYLHHQWMNVIIHRDIKASNVLLDSEMNGRLGDFGLARLCDHGIDPQTTHLAGTLGYIAPELARTGKANTRTDLFAFGAFLLSVACGRRPVQREAAPERILLVDWVTESWRRGTILETVDPKLGTEYVVEEAELVLKLGLLCSHPVAEARPSMSCVLKYLEGDAPLPEDFSADVLVRGGEEVVYETAPSSASTLEKFSVPSLTITEQFISGGR
uniref:non-specific serine/threonine protein kinase n=1 Tax=Nelumbo nucifera TaxID=4432 RepID=A0A822YEF3_NELNU|nr:TPA_asm: hypothetical protein HUJ06_030813 [Nelumbo nucifera]